jgi:hypothetical protein
MKRNKHIHINKRQNKATSIIQTITIITFLKSREVCVEKEKEVYMHILILNIINN